MTGLGGPSCDRGDGDRSSGSSPRLLRPLKLPSRHAFASQPERGAGGVVGGGRGGGGGDARSRRLLLILCGDGSNSKMLLPAKSASWEHLFRPVATQHISWEVVFTHHNELLHDSLEPSHPQNVSWSLVSFPPCATSDAHDQNHPLRSLYWIVHPNRRDRIFHRFLAELISFFVIFLFFISYFLLFSQSGAHK